MKQLALVGRGLLITGNIEAESESWHCRDAPKIHSCIFSAPPCRVLLWKELYTPTLWVVQTVRSLPTKQETRFDPGVGKMPWKGMATHSSIPAWRIPWTEEPGRLQLTGSQRVGHNWVTFTFTLWTQIGPHGTFWLMRCMSAMCDSQNEAMRTSRSVPQLLFAHRHHSSPTPSRGHTALHTEVLLHSLKQNHTCLVTMMQNQSEMNIHICQPPGFRDCLLAQHNLAYTDRYRNRQTGAMSLFSQINCIGMQPHRSKYHLQLPSHHSGGVK